MAPILGDGCEGSALFTYLNTNKRSVTLDVNSAADFERLHRLIATADAVVKDRAPAWAERHPTVVFCSITPYGQDEAVEFENARSINVFHASGWGYHTPSHADPATPPLQGPGRFLADYEAGLDAALCVASSLFGRLHTGRGESIDISQHAVLVSRADCVVGRFITGEVEASGGRNDYDQAGPAAFFACADGFVYLYMTSRAHWLGLKELMLHPDWLDAFEDDWLEFSVTARHSPQYRHRGFFQSLRHPALGDAEYPTVPYAFSASPAGIASAAPALGQHTDMVLDAPALMRARFGGAVPARAAADAVEPPEPVGTPLRGDLLDAAR